MKKSYHLIPFLSLFFSFALKGNHHYDSTYIYLTNATKFSLDCRTKDPFLTRHLKVSSKDKIHPLARKLCSAHSKEDIAEVIKEIKDKPQSRRFIKFRIKSRWFSWRGLKAILPDHIIHYQNVTPEEMLSKLGF